MNRVELRALIAALVIGLINGVIWVFIVPPWQHYDEPNHFEYAWLIANRSKQPEVGDFDPVMRLEVATSMVEHGFFDHTDTKPDLTVTDKPAWIGTYSQISSPPLYYWIVSLPLRTVMNQSIETQLYTARLVSLLLYLVTILAGWGVAIEISRNGHPIRLLLPACIALLPGFTDLVTAVNSDAGAVAAFSIFLWACVRLILRGPSFCALVVAIASAGVGIFIKEINFLALPLLVVALFFTFLRNRLVKAAWALVVIGFVVGIVSVVEWGDAALWGRWFLQEPSTREAFPGSPLGSYVLRMDLQPQPSPRRRAQINQILVPADAQRMNGQMVTVGAWIWATQPMETNAPILHVYESNQEYTRRVNVGVEPTFFAYTATIQGPSARAWISLMPTAALMEPAPTVYYDGIVLAEGARPLDDPPIFDNEMGESGRWGDIPFKNLVRNGSAERSGPFIRAWADRLGVTFLPDGILPSWVVYYVLDRPAIGWYHQMGLAHLFRTFWGLFGWGHVPLLGARPYRMLAFLTGVIAIGIAVAAWQRRKSSQKTVYFFLLLAIAGVWGLALMRVANYILYRPYFPVARYTYPVLIPVLGLCLAGLGSLFLVLSRRLRLPGWIPSAATLTVFAALDVWGILSVLVFYRGYT